MAWSYKNRLINTGSPYLEQHKDNPVHWLPWDEKAFEEARRRDLPILVSIGYSTCHWCHVMARESFESPRVAELMNNALINIKIDREQHPGVDAVYMEAAQVMNPQAGWPLNVFIDHGGRPFMSLTYRPPEHWINLVSQVHHLWKENRERINETAASISAHLSEKSLPAQDNIARLPIAFLRKVNETFDKANPGLAMLQTPIKFPPSQAIDWLLEQKDTQSSSTSPPNQAKQPGRQMALGILIAMMDSGLHDRVGGGFHRYSTDPEWRVPHFEKMTYDNAQLMGLYARAAVLVSENKNLSRAMNATARGIADWMLREMRVESADGTFLGYATATDADDALGEGSFFAWPPFELKRVLGTEDAKWLAEHWDLSGEGTLPENHAEDPHGGSFEPVPGWIPHPRGAQGYGNRADGVEAETDANREAGLSTQLLNARLQRPAPQRDDKVLTDQNALVLEGFSRLARYDKGLRYHKAAVELADLLLTRMNLRTEERAPDRPHVIRSIFGKDTMEPYITDYGYLAMAMCAVYSLTGNPQYIRAAELVSREAVRRMASEDGAYFSTPVGSNLYKRPMEDFDGPSPAGQHALGIAFARLYAVTGRPEWKDKANQLLRARGTIAERAPSATPTLIRLASIQGRPYTFVVAGASDDPMTRHLLQQTRRLTGPDAMIVAAEQAKDNSPEKNGTGSEGNWVELEGRMGMERPQLLVCRERSCLPPAYTPEEARQRLEESGA